jgi:hypothetical protein
LNGSNDRDGVMEKTGNLEFLKEFSGDGSGSVIEI